MKRFFLVDVISGITGTGGFELKDPPDYIQYAKTIRLRIEVLRGRNEIYRPMLFIEYEQKSTSDLEDNPYVEVYFNVGFRFFSGF